MPCSTPAARWNCNRGVRQTDGQMNDSLGDALAQAQAVKTKYETELLRKKNVVGVGLGFMPSPRGETVAIMVNVTRKEPESHLAEKDIIPKMLDNVPVNVVETGTIHAL